jgi:hypothetical protein
MIEVIKQRLDLMHKEDLMIKKLAILFGAVFLLVGILGFFPALTPANAEGERHLLGLFEVDTVHNVVHLLSGAVALAAGLLSGYASRLYFKIFGAVYALVTLVGMISGSALGLFHVNGADNFLHLALAVALLAIGFATPVSDDEARNHAAA